MLVVFILEGETIFKFLDCLSARQSNPPALHEGGSDKLAQMMMGELRN